MKRTEDDILKNMFCLMSEEKLSPAFQQNMMLRIQKEAIRIRKRNTIVRFCALFVASLMIISLAVVSFIYLDMPDIEIPTVSISPFYLFVGIISLVLLFADSWFRKMYYKKHSELE